MKRIIIILFLLLISYGSFSQSLYGSFYVNGNVKDYNTSEPLSYCSVIFMQKDSIHFFAMTDEKGYFEISATPGTYKVIFRFVGYISDTITLVLKNKNKFLGNIFLKVDEKMMKEVEISASTRSNFIDKDQHIVTDQMRKEASKAADILDKVDGITFDRYKNEIKVDNESNILLLVNGLEKNQEYIKNLNPERIAKIEVIRDPSGKYGFQGYSSVVNLILKRNYVGEDIFVSINSIMDFDAQDPKYFFLGNGAYLSYNYSRKTLNLYGMCGVTNMNIALLNSQIREYKDSIKIEQKPESEKDINFVNENLYSFMTFGADYQITPKHTVSFDGRLNISPKSNQKNHYDINYWQDTNIILNQKYILNSRSQNMNYSGRMFYISNISENESLQPEFGTGGSQSNNKNNFTYDNNPTFVNEKNGTENYTRFSVEWTKAINRKFSYQIGYGNSWNNMKSSPVSGQNQSVDFESTDFRHRAFGYTTLKLIKKLTIKTGIGVENSSPTQNNYKKNYWIYKPHLDIQYKPNQTINFKLKYRAKPNYPSLAEVNPIEIFLDNKTVQKGNPYLSPSTVHSSSLRINLAGGFLFSELFYKFSNNMIASVGKLREKGIFEYSYDNLGNYEKKGVKIGVTIPIYKQSLIWQSNLTFYKSKILYNYVNNEISDWRGESYLMLMNRRHNFFVGLMMQKNSAKIITAQGFQQNNFNSLGIIAQKQFSKPKITTMIMFMLPTSLMLSEEQENYTQTPFYTQQDITNFDVVNNVLIIKISYRFQKGRIMKKLDKGNQEEQQNNKPPKGLF